MEKRIKKRYHDYLVKTHERFFEQNPQFFKIPVVDPEYVYSNQDPPEQEKRVWKIVYPEKESAYQTFVREEHAARMIQIWWRKVLTNERIPVGYRWMCGIFDELVVEKEKLAKKNFFL
jgi:hypothetical protein